MKHNPYGGQPGARWVRSVSFKKKSMKCAFYKYLSYGNLEQSKKARITSIHKRETISDKEITQNFAQGHVFLIRMVLIHTASRSTGCGQLSNKHWLAEIQKCAICSPLEDGRAKTRVGEVACDPSLFASQSQPEPRVNNKQALKKQSITGHQDPRDSTGHGALSPPPLFPVECQ